MCDGFHSSLAPFNCPVYKGGYMAALSGHQRWTSAIAEPPAEFFLYEMD